MGVINYPIWIIMFSKSGIDGYWPILGFLSLIHHHKLYHVVLFGLFHGKYTETMDNWCGVYHHDFGKPQMIAQKKLGKG